MPPEPRAPVSASPSASMQTSAQDDWPAQAADTIVSVVEKVRDRTTGPAITATRAVVFGLLAMLGTVALVIFSVLLLRVTVIGVDAILDAADLDRPGRAVWIAFFVDGALFLLIGLVLWRKAVARTA